MNSRLALLALLGALASMLAGCASNQVPIRARGPSGGMQGSAWELVMPGPEVAGALVAADSRQHPAYMTRRDAALGATTPSWAPVGASGDTPPSIAYQQSVYVRRSHDSFLFFTRPGFVAPGGWPAAGPWPYHHPQRYPGVPRRWDP